MASVVKNNGSPYWVAIWRDATGKRKNRSTKISNSSANKKEALAIADEYEVTSKKGKTSKQLKKTISDINEKFHGNSIIAPTFKKFSEEFLIHKSGNVKDSTIDSYMRSFRYFEEVSPDLIEKEIDEIQESDLDKFNNLLSERIRSRTVGNHIKNIRALFSLAVKRGLIDTNPAESIKVDRKGTNKHGTNLKRAFTEHELKLLMDKLTGEWRSMVIFAIYTGQRLGDIATLRWSSLDLESDRFSIATMKTGRRVTIPLNPNLRKHILELSKNSKSDYVHPKSASHYLKNESKTLSNQFSRLLFDLGLKPEYSKNNKKKKNASGRNGKRTISELCYHSLRVTAITFLHKANIPMAVVQNWVGHDCAEVHQIYIKMGEDAMKQASNALPDIGV